MILPVPRSLYFLAIHEQADIVNRTYHAYKEGKYFLPNDEDENSRLDLQNHMYLITREGKLTTCAFDKDFPIHNVLDLGTGTGIWAIDYGMCCPGNTETKLIS